MIDSPYRVDPDSKVHLDKFSTDDTGDFGSKSDAASPTDKNLEKLESLQDLLYADGRYALLVVLQAMDAGGKDGTIRHVFSGVNPQGCQVTSFKKPSDLESAHDFLWRVHEAVPRRGIIGIFNRSHYESVLVERVAKLVPKDVWSRRYDHINDFERMLVDERTVILKFFLHISKKEQKRRMEARLKDPSKNWKFSKDDLSVRAQWDAYQEAYEDALAKCSTEHAPWYIVPSDHKWYRNWVVSDLIVRTLKRLDLRYPSPQSDLDKITVK